MTITSTTLGTQHTFTNHRTEDIPANFATGIQDERMSRIDELAEDHAESAKSQRAQLILAEQTRQLKTKISLTLSIKKNLLENNPTVALSFAKSVVEMLQAQIEQENQINSRAGNLRLHSLKKQLALATEILLSGGKKNYLSVELKKMDELLQIYDQEMLVINGSDHHYHITNYSYELEKRAYKSQIISDPDNEQWETELYPERGPFGISGGLGLGAGKYPEEGTPSSDTLASNWHIAAGWHRYDVLENTFFAVEGTLEGRVAAAPFEGVGLRATGAYGSVGASATYYRSFDGEGNYTKLSGGIHFSDQPNRNYLVGAEWLHNWSATPSHPEDIYTLNWTTYLNFGKK